MTPILSTRDLSLAYGAELVVPDLNLTIEPGAITTLVGPNGCGKSTVLRALVRLLAPRRGAAYLDGHAVHRLPTRQVAQTLGLLSQHASAPQGLTVLDLVRRARYPRLGPWEPLGTQDEAAVARALEVCGVTDLAHRPVDELSGGQRQRAWIALAVAQDTPILLLDEPTTFLDSRAQSGVLDLVRHLHDEGKTIVLVLHDLVQAAAISDRIVALKNGRIAAEGGPSVLTPSLLHDLYGVEFDVGQSQGRPVPVPRSRLSLEGPPGPGPGPRLEAEGLEFGYPGRVLGRTDLTLGPGGFTAVLGPNGSGKSTLLRTMAGLQAPLGGAAFVDGHDVHRLSGRRTALLRAFLAQEAEVPPGFTVRDLVALGRFSHRGRGRSPEDDRVVNQALGALDLASWADHDARALSGGQKQRVWLAQALAQESPLLILDEPTSFLDPGHQIELLDALWSLTRTGSRTVVAILHDAVLARRYADRVVELGGDLTESVK